MSDDQTGRMSPRLLGSALRLPAKRFALFVGLRKTTVFYTLVVMICLYVFMQMFVLAGPTVFALNVSIRYLLWPLILIAAAVHIIVRGISDIVLPWAIFLPFFAIGVVSGLLCVEPLEAVRNLAFWLLAVLAAAAAGRQLGERLVGQLLFWGFGLAALLSILTALFFPQIGLVHDGRVGGGVAWAGAFTGKNWLGWYAGFALLSALTAPAIRWPLRAIVAIMALICIYFAHSGGAVVQAILLVGFIAALQVIRRLNLSAVLKGMLVGTGALLAVVLTILFSDQALALLGRDATLTGRTVIWRLYFDRAMETWFLGAGPGSFTHLAVATQDIGLSLRGFGGIQTPHNMYIAIFGEVGVVGLISLLVALFYLAFVQPFRHAGLASLMLAGFTFSLLVSGFGETHEVFGMGIAMFVLVLLRAAIGHGEGGGVLGQTAPAVEAGASGDPSSRALQGPAALG